jgi:hypothetical protein
MQLAATRAVPFLRRLPAPALEGAGEALAGLAS